MKKHVILFLSVILITLLSCQNSKKKKFGYSIKSKTFISIGKENGAGKASVLENDNFSLEVNVQPSKNVVQHHDYGTDFLIEFSQKTGQVMKASFLKNKEPYFDYVSINGFYYAIHTDMNLMIGKIDSYLRKFDKNWKLIWSKRIEKSVFPDTKSHLIFTPQDQLLLVLDDHYGNEKIQETYLAILKYNLNGELITDKRFFKQELIRPELMIKTFDNNYVFSLLFGRDFTMDMLLVKVNSIGDTLWSKKFNDFNVEKALQLKDSSFLFFGYHYSLINNGAEQSQKLKVIKTDNNGNLLWQKTIKISKMDQVADMFETDNGDYLFLSQISLKENGGDFPFLILINSSGKIIWYKLLTQSVGIFSSPTLLKVKDGFFLINGKSTKYGTFSRDIVLTKFIEN